MEIFKILGRIALDGVDEAGSKLDKLKGIASKLGSGVKVAGKAFAGLSAAVIGISVAIGTASVKAGAAFDAQMSTVKSISGATAEEFEALKEKAKEMGATTSFSATESAQALEYMAMAGWTTQQMIDGLAGVMNLAAASGEDLATTSDIVTDAMTAFGMEAERSEYFSDVLAKTASSANTNVSMMGETFKYVAPLAGAMGYKIEDMSVAIGLMANSGIKGSQAGTSLRGVITNLATPTDKVARAMDDLGISLTTSEGEMKPFREVLDEMRDSFSGLDETQRTAYASMIAGKEGMSGLLAMINSSDDDFEELTKEIENCSGAAKEMADVRLDNLSGDVTLFKSALEGAGIAISYQLSPTLREIVQSATEMIPKTQDILVKFGGKLAEIGSKLLPVLISAVEMLLPVITDVLDVIGDMADELLPSFMDILDTVVPVLSEIVTDIAPFISQLLKTVMDILTPICKNLLPPLSKLLKALLDILSPILDVLAPIVTFMTDLASTLIGDVVGAIAILFGYDDHDELIEKFSKLSESEQAVIDKTNELVEEQDRLHGSMQNGFNNIDSTYIKYDKLIGKLDTMVDSTGKVKEGYEDQVYFILNGLNDAFGNGCMVLHKEEKIFKVNKIKKVPEEEWVYCENALPPIISKQEHEEIVAIIKSRKKEMNYSRYHGKYPLSSKIICGLCGSTYHRTQKWNKKRNTCSTAWICKRAYREGREKNNNAFDMGCNGENIDEGKLLKLIEETSERFFTSLFTEDNNIIEQCLLLINKALNDCGGINILEKLKKELKRLNQKQEKLFDKLTDGVISDGNFKKYNDMLNSDITDLEQQIKLSEANTSNLLENKKRLEVIKEQLYTGDIIKRAMGQCVIDKIDKIIVNDNGTITINYNKGKILGLLPLCGELDIEDNDYSVTVAYDGTTKLKMRTDSEKRELIRLIKLYPDLSYSQYAEKLGNNATRPTVASRIFQLMKHNIVKRQDDGTLAVIGEFE